MQGSYSRSEEQCSGFQWNEKPERLVMKSGFQRKHCVLKESKYVDLVFFSLSVLF